MYIHPWSGGAIKELIPKMVIPNSSLTMTICNSKPEKTGREEMMATPEELYVCFQREESKVRRRQTIEPRQPDYSIDWFKGVGRHELQLT